MHPHKYQQMIERNARAIMERRAEYSGIQYTTKSKAKGDRASIKRTKAWRNVPRKTVPSIKAPLYEWMTGAKVWC